MPRLIITSVSALGGLTFLLATLLIIANRKLFVAEDPRIDVVEDSLPKANCGGCGYPSCRAFAEGLVNGEVLPAECNVSSEEQRTEIATFLNVDVGAEVNRWRDWLAPVATASPPAKRATPAFAAARRPIRSAAAPCSGVAFLGKGTTIAGETRLGSHRHRHCERYRINRMDQ